jgi:hypothetical protein
MDTPQVEPSLLEHRWGRADAVLGLSDDGGFWAIGLRDADPYAVFDGIEMSTDRTGAIQFARLLDLNLSVQLLPPLRDIDEPADAEVVANRHPQLRFSRRYQALVAECHEQPMDRMFDGLYAGSKVRSRSAARDGSGLVLDGARWSSLADPVDQVVVSRCEPPVIDVGCGPGRMVRALQQSGEPCWASTSPASRSRRGQEAAVRCCDDTSPSHCRARVAGAQRCFWTATSASEATSVGCSAAAGTWSAPAV